MINLIEIALLNNVLLSLSKELEICEPYESVVIQ